MISVEDRVCCSVLEIVRFRARNKRTCWGLGFTSFLRILRLLWLGITRFHRLLWLGIIRFHRLLWDENKETFLFQNDP